MTSYGPRHNIVIPDELWERIQMAALKAGVKRKRPMSASEWIREVVTEKLGGSK